MVNVSVNQCYDSNSRDDGNCVAYNASMMSQLMCKYIVNEGYNHLGNHFHTHSFKILGL